jgi:hypothetical protein
MLMVDDIECVSRGDNRASRQVVCDATSRRGAVRSGGWNFPRPLVRPFAHPPDSTHALSPIIHRLTPSNLPRPPPRALSSRYIVAVGLALHLGIELINVSRPIRRSALAESDTSGEITFPRSPRIIDRRALARAIFGQARVRFRCSIAQCHCWIDEHDNKRS